MTKLINHYRAFRIALGLAFGAPYAIETLDGVSGPIQVRSEALISAMRRLRANNDFSMLRSLWLGARGEILDQGKKTPKSETWSELKGFDRAISEIDKWANMQTVEDIHKQRAAQLQATLAGTEPEESQ